jgi:hypothetical protein
MIEKGTTKERIEERKRRSRITSVRRSVHELERSTIADGGMLERKRQREGSLVAGGGKVERGGEGRVPGGRQQHA